MDLGMPRIQVEIIAELAFLRIFIAWENFLEASFLRYLVGAKSPSGYMPVRLITPKNIGHALDLLCSGREYVKWNSTSEVIARSETCFRDGEPYKTVLESVRTVLNNLNTIRNRITHRSVVSMSKFNDFARKILGYGKRGMTPGRFLLTKLPSDPQMTFLDYYVRNLETASIIIVR